MAVPQLPSGYQLRAGSKRDRVHLLRFMERTYSELFPEQKDFSHLETTIEQYLGDRTPLWWVNRVRERVACLWMGNAVHQINGNAYTHIFLLYVAPAHRHRGIATYLLTKAQDRAKERGDPYLGIQVFTHNTNAHALYRRFGFEDQSISLIKPLE